MSNHKTTHMSTKIGLFSDSSFVLHDSKVVLNFPYKDAVLEAGMNKEDTGRDERFLHSEIHAKEIDTLFEPKVLTNFAYFEQNVPNQPINQSTNQPINQSTNQPINQSTNHYRLI